jgi:LuxR family maltose regulon positive regulatory protein
VTVVSAPAGSGKTVLIRSWVTEAGLADRAAWVSVGRDDRDPQRFWLSVVGALRRTTPGSALVRALAASPDLDGWAIVERLLEDLARLQDRIWLVIDDVHELGPDQALRQLELLVMRAPPPLRFVLAARHDVRLGLHRLRLEGELGEIRAEDLRFSGAEAAELFATTGVKLPEPAVAMLHERTEGWAAGLRLAALAAAGHPDPERFAARFSGTDRTVADYLLAEVLDRQDERVRRLLLRTSLLEQVNGDLAELLTGDKGAERVLQDLEAANAFVVSLDDGRTWFRYHQLFAELLRLELRRTEPAAVNGLHQAATGWLAGHGYLVEAVRQAQASGDWELAAQLLTDHWPTMHLNGQAATVHDLLTAFPTETRAADGQLATLVAADELASGSLEGAERYLRMAERGSVPAERRGQFHALLGVVRLLHARQRANPQAVAEEAQRLVETAEATKASQPQLSEDLRSLGLISLGNAEVWTAQYGEANRHLEQGIALARRVGRSYLEFSGLVNLSVAEFVGTAETRGPFARIAERSRLAIELAQRNGWNEEPTAGLAYLMLGTVLAWQGRPEEAEPWVQYAERTVTADSEPGAAIGVSFARVILEMARGQYSDALAAAQAGERQARRLDSSDLLVPRARALQLLMLARLGDIERGEQTLAGLEESNRERGDVRMGTAALRLAQDDPRAAAAALAPVLTGSDSLFPWTWLAHAFLLQALAEDALGDQTAADDALERALELAEPDGAVLWFLVHRAPDLLDRHARTRTAHASLLVEIQTLLAGRTPAPAATVRPLLEPLSESELRVLRYLPTNLRAPEIARELYVSTSTVKTHIQHLYAKLGAHRRAEAVESARTLGLLAPSRAGRASPRPVSTATH